MPLAARAGGTGQVEYVEDLQAYRFVFPGSPALTLELDLTHPDVVNGRLALRHMQSNRYPLAGTGLYYRSTEGALLEPRMLRLVGPTPIVTHEALAAIEALQIWAQPEAAEARRNPTAPPAGKLKDALLLLRPAMERDNSPLMRLYAGQALLSLGQPDALSAAWKHIDDDSWVVRAMAARYLKAMFLNADGGNPASALLTAQLFAVPNLLWMAAAAIVVWMVPNSQQLLQRFTAPKLALCLGGFVISLGLMFAQGYSPFLYFQF